MTDVILVSWKLPNAGNQMPFPSETHITKIHCLAYICITIQDTQQIRKLGHKQKFKSECRSRGEEENEIETQIDRDQMK